MACLVAASSISFFEEKRKAHTFLTHFPPRHYRLSIGPLISFLVSAFLAARCRIGLALARPLTGPMCLTTMGLHVREIATNQTVTGARVRVD